MAQTLRVVGYREAASALNKVNRKAKATLFAGLRAAAEPIALDARQRLMGYQGMSTSTIRPSATQRGVVVVQRKKKTTGKRPDFGSLQMKQGLLPALYQNQDDISQKVEDAFTALILTEGL